MKKLIYFISMAGVLTVASCKKESLQVANPNQPTFQSLTTEAGLTNFSLGLINRQLGNVINAGSVNLLTVAMVNHSTMGDEWFMPYGNWGVRWTNQVYSVTPPGGSAIVNPFGVTQLESLQGFNSRQAGDRNGFLYEWFWAYNYIAQCNQILAAVDNPALTLEGDVATKKALFKAWALWWKGYAYSRLGSMYLAAAIVNEPGKTTGDFVKNTDVIVEANKVLDACATALNGISANAEYAALFKAITPSYNAPNDVVTPDMWKRIINTIKARNLMANKKVSAMNATDWQQVITLTNAGIQQGDKVFRQGYTADGNNDVVGAFYHPFWLIGSTAEFCFVSERLIQEYKTGDARLARDWFTPPANAWYPANIRSRGLQFGTRYAPVDIELGGSFSTSTGALATLQIAGSWEENALSRAEALIYTNQIEQGLQIVDQVRTAQGANLPAVAGTGLNQTQAIAELRRERRVALYVRGTAFYDARRWGRTAPLSAGGGRSDAVVFLPGSLIGGGADAARVCVMDYRYVDYFDVPQNELDFNPPSSVSAPVKN
jgi:hypothetical protein